LPAVQRAIQADDDVLIVAAFDEDLFENSPLLGDDAMTRVALAQRRLQWLSEVRAALKRRDSTRLRDLLFDPPEGGPERLSGPERRRVRLAIEREQALKDLGTAIGLKEDQAVISALNKVERVGARISDRKTWSDVQRVVERVSIVDELLEAAEGDTLDYARVAQLIPAVKALGLERDPRLGGSQLIERLEDQLVRMAHVRRIQAAIARDNDLAIVTAAVPDPRDALSLLTQGERDRVAEAIKKRRDKASTHTRRGGDKEPSPPA
jgi:hypothetical protein